MQEKVPTKPANILLVEDDLEDQWATKKAFEQLRLRSALFVVDNGKAALDFLHHRTPYEDSHAYPTPDLVLLDLNLPGVDGREVLREIKTDPELKRIAVVVLTTSSEQEDVVRTYELGVNSFLTKPVGFDAFLETIGDIGRYWLQVVVLPSH